MNFVSTEKKRINVSLSDHLASALEKLAKRDSLPTATKASQLIELALEFEEDSAWNTIATERDKKKAQFVSHQRAWL